MSECDESKQGLKEPEKAFTEHEGGKIVYVLRPSEEIPSGLRDMLATWPGIADDPNWKDHPQLLAHVERGEFRGGGKWVQRNRKQVFLKDYHGYKFNEQLRCWQWSSNHEDSGCK